MKRLVVCFLFLAIGMGLPFAGKAQERRVPAPSLRSDNTIRAAGSLGVNRNPAYQQLSPEELLRTIFVNTGVCSSITNVTVRTYGWDGDEWTDQTLSNRGMAYFNREDFTAFPIPEGLMLSTGNSRDVEGPNSSDSAISDNSSVSGDADLQGLLSSGNVTSVSILEFDFVPTGTSMSFEYIFGSEEYPEYVNSQYNDVFGFFINQVAPTVTAKQNIALLPNNGGVVSINNVNNGGWTSNTYQTAGGYGTSTTASHSQYFVPNPGGSLGTELDGYTVLLTASATVVPCRTYRLKLAVGNVGDDAYGSAVFLRANSFNAGIALEVYGNTIAGMDSIFINCDQNYLRFDAGVTATVSRTVNVRYEGTAINGTHYTQPDGTALPTTITIPAGATYVDIPFKTTSSAVHGSYFDVITPCICDSETADTRRVMIYENNVSISSVAMGRPCVNGSNGTITVSATGGSGSYEYSINNGSTWQNSNVFTGLTVGTYTVFTRSKGACQQDVSQQVTLTAFTSDAGTDQTDCKSVFTMAGQQPATGETGTWTVVGASSGITIANPSLYNTNVTLNLAQTETATLRWTLNNGSCAAYDDVVINYKPCTLPVNPHIRSHFK
jgi:hypothetical protein